VLAGRFWSGIMLCYVLLLYLWHWMFLAVHICSQLMLYQFVCLFPVIVWCWCSSNVNLNCSTGMYVWSLYVVCINTFHDALFISAIVSKVTVLTGFSKIMSYNLLGMNIHSKTVFPCNKLWGTIPLKMCWQCCTVIIPDHWWKLL
jgi:hypothetical protein